MGNPDKPVITTAADPTVLRIVPELAEEIGLNESIALLQLSHWIKNANNLRDGKWWTYQSIRDMKDKAFKFWGIGTISRVIVSLENKGLIFVANHNQRKGDKTGWYALNPEGLSKLNSIQVAWIDPETGVFQNGTARSKMEQPVGGEFQSGTPKFQNGTTLPESTSEISLTESAAKGAEPVLEFPAHMVGFEKRNNGRTHAWVQAYSALLGHKGKVQATHKEMQLLLERERQYTLEQFKACTAEKLREKPGAKLLFVLEDMPNILAKLEAPKPEYRTMSPAEPAPPDHQPLKGEALEAYLKEVAEKHGRTYTPPEKAQETA